MRKLMVALASTLAALLVAEWVFGRWYPVGGCTYQLDPVLLHATLPNSRRIQPMPARAGGARILIRVNSDGYRGPELEDTGRTRVAVYGDSLVMAENVAYEDSFPARLAQALGEDVETVSAGASGYGPDQVCLRLERELEALAPDLVVFVLCATNDMGDLLRNKLFALDGDTLVQTQPQLAASERVRFEEILRAGSRPALLRAWESVGESRRARELEKKEASRPAPDLISEYLEQAAWEYQTAVLEGDRMVYSLLADVYDADVAIEPESASALYKRNLLAGVLSRARQACAAKGIPLVCVVVPSAVDLDPRFRIRVSRARYPGYDPTHLSDACTQAAQAAGLEVRDLFDLFADNDPGHLFVGWDDIHWNKAGISLAARDVAAWLQTLEGVSLPAR